MNGTMTGRKIATLALVVVAIGLERFAYYASRAVFFMYLTRDGKMTTAAMGVVSGIASAVVAFAPLVGGALAIAVGPRVVALAGAVLATAGYFMLAAGASPYAYIAVGAFGVGLFKPCLWAIVADEASRDEVAAGVDPESAPPSARRFVVAAAVFALMYGATNGGAMIGPPLTAAMADKVGVASAFNVAGVVSFVVLILAIALVALAPRRPPRVVPPPQPIYRAPHAPADPVAPSSTAHALGGVALLLVAMIPFDVASALGPDPSEFSQARVMWLYSINPIVVILATVVLFAILLAFALGRTRPVLTRWIGGALIATSFGCALLAVGGFSGGLAIVVAGTAIDAAAEPIVAASAMTYAALAAPSRFRTLVVGAWLAIPFPFTMAASVFCRTPTARLSALVAVALLLLLAGILALALGRRLHASLFDRRSLAVAPGHETQ
jgi:dipeptide/tripeptide permease